MADKDFNGGERFVGGSKPSRKNKMNIALTVATAYENVYNRLGGEDGLFNWASTDINTLTIFYTQFSKMLPRASDLTSDGKPLNIGVMNYKANTNSGSAP